LEIAVTDVSRTLPAPATTTRDDAAVASFLDRYTGATRQLYDLDLRIFRGWCTDQGIRLLDVKRPDLERFGQWLITHRGNRPLTARRRMQTLRSFYRLMYADELLDRDPTVLMRMPKARREPERLVWLDRFQVGALIRTARQTSPDHLAAVTLMARLGLRVSAAAAARWENLTRSPSGEWTLTVREKGGRMHTAIVPPAVLDDLEPARRGRTEGPIVLKRNGKPQDRDGLQRWVRLLAEKTGRPKGTSPHSLRRAAIRILLDADVPIERVREFAGHASISTTELYHPTRGNVGVPPAHIISAALDLVA
jgi:integrase/recombinase XerD